MWDIFRDLSKNIYKTLLIYQFKSFIFSGENRPCQVFFLESFWKLTGNWTWKNSNVYIYFRKQEFVKLSYKLILVVLNLDKMIKHNILKWYKVDYLKFFFSIFLSLKFHLISWCGNFVELDSFSVVSGESPETQWKLSLSTKFP